MIGADHCTGPGATNRRRDLGMKGLDIVEGRKPSNVYLDDAGRTKTCKGRRPSGIATCWPGLSRHHSPRRSMCHGCIVEIKLMRGLRSSRPAPENSSKEGHDPPVDLKRPSAVDMRKQAARSSGQNDPFKLHLRHGQIPARRRHQERRARCSLREKALACIKEAERWRDHPPSVEKREALMKKVLGLHTAVSRLGRGNP